MAACENAASTRGSCSRPVSATASSHGEAVMLSRNRARPRDDPERVDRVPER